MRTVPMESAEGKVKFIFSPDGFFKIGQKFHTDLKMISKSNT